MKTIFLFVLVLSGTACFSQNLIVNPGFESWDKVTKPSGWTTADKCLKDSANVHSGAYSCKQYATLAATKSAGQKLPVSEGKKYNLSFYYKTEVSGTEHGCRIWCHWEDGSNNIIVDPLTDPVLEPSTYMKSDSWQQFSIDITAPVSASFFVLEVRTYQNSVAYLDDFSFAESVATQAGADPFEATIIFPNPASDYIHLNSPREIRHVEIRDIKGLKVWSSEYRGESFIKMPVESLTPGPYIIIIDSGNRILIRKFIKIN